jgi:hypothetical protein
MGLPSVHRRGGRLLASSAIAGASSALLVSGVAACSVVDGWSDLQGGRAPGDARAKDAQLGEEDGGGFADGNVGPTPPLCGAASCAQGEGCCISLSNGAKQCTSQQVCLDRDDLFLGCTARSSCSSSAPLCCFDYTDEQSSCLARCGPGQQELCSTADPRPCTSGACTSSLAGMPDTPSCE